MRLRFATPSSPLDLGPPARAAGNAQLTRAALDVLAAALDLMMRQVGLLVMGQPLSSFSELVAVESTLAMRTCSVSWFGKWSSRSSRSDARLRPVHRHV